MSFFDGYDLSRGFGPQTSYTPGARLSDAYSPTSRGFGTYAAVAPRTARQNAGLSADEWAARIQGWITDGSQVFRSFERPAGQAPPAVVVQAPAPAINPTLLVGAGLAVVALVLLTRRR